MKITGISTALIVGLTLAASQSAAAADGTIEFTGSVVATTCTIDGQAPGTGTITKNVDLGGVNVGQLDTAGKTAGEQGFIFQIGATGESGCTDGQTAYVRFDKSSPLLDPMTGRLDTETGTGAAKAVQVELLNGEDGSVINAFTQDSIGYPIVGNQARIPLIGRMYSTGTATVGSVTSRVGFEVVYD